MNGSWSAHALMLRMPYPVYTTDPDGFILACNPAATRLWGVQPTLGVTRWCGSHLLYRSDGARIAHEDCALARSLRTGREVNGERSIIETTDGRRVEVVAYPSLLRSDDGTIVGAANALVPNSVAVATAELHPRLAAIVTSSHDAIVSKDLNGIITSWNASAQRLFGYTADEIVGKSVTILIPPELQDEEPLILSRMRKGEVVDHFETVRMRKDGSRFPISLTISPIRGPDGSIIGVSKIARDITEKKDSERRIGELLKEVNHRVKNQFAVILSMVRETSSRTVDPARVERLVRERIMALSRTHDLLVHNDWRGVPLRDLLLAHLRSAGDEDLLLLSGPHVTLGPMAAQYLGMAFHELSMNSAEGGALAKGERLRVCWSLSGSRREQRLALHWREPFQGGAPFLSVGDSFSEVLLCRAAPRAISGQASFAVAGGELDWVIEAPLADLTAVFGVDDFSAPQPPPA